MKLLDIIKELNLNPHFSDRMNERIFTSKLEAFIKYKENGEYVNLKIGTYNLQPNVIAEIQNNIDFVNNPEVKVDPGIVFAIIMHRFNMYEVLKGIDFDEDIEKRDVLYAVRNKEVRLQLGDEKTKTYGVSLVWVVKNDRVITAMFSDTTSKEQLYDKLKSGRNKYDNLVTLNSPEELEYYYSGENDDFTALK